MSRRIDLREARVLLLEAGPRWLPQFSPRLSAKAAARLAALGVEVRPNTRVEDIGEGFLRLADGSGIESANIIWAAGVAANPLTRMNTSTACRRYFELSGARVENAGWPADQANGCACGRNNA
jgi:NADH dehydrogenase FAD-containing subunit